jgi:hypothetical protein
MNGSLQMPPWTTNDRGEPRRVGVELEMIGLNLDEIATVVAEWLGASVTHDGRYRRMLHGDADGEWCVELDFRLLRRLGREDNSEQDLMGDLKTSAETLLNLLSDPLVPREVVSPPLPLHRLQELEGLILRLRRAGARGTSDSMRYAFGMHFNADIPSRDSAVIAAVMKAFVCLYDWLHQRARVDISRRISTFVAPFPLPYVRRLIAPDYQPSLSQLIDDYLADNPTRNRALDMLPLFAELDEARVRARLDDPLVKARPAFHYRMPNCDIHVEDWSLAPAWNDWVEVERLAADSARLGECCSAYARFLDQPLHRWLGDWTAELECKWLSAP